MSLPSRTEPLQGDGAPSESSGSGMAGTSDAVMRVSTPPELPRAIGTVGPSGMLTVPAPPRRGWARRTLRFFFLLILPVSLLLNLLHFLESDSLSSSRGVATIQVAPGDSEQQVAVAPLDGEIDSAAAERLDRFLGRAEETDGVKALVVEIDSPGGTVTAADEIYQRILRYKAARRQKLRSDIVVISMKSMATSGGYYAACAGDYIFGEPTTLTGNIGVLMPSLNFSGLLQKYGVEETTITSTGAVYKNAGSPYRPQDEKDRRYLQSLADQAFYRFKKVVSDGRGAKLTRNMDELADGRVFAATEAKDLGLIDEIGYPHDAYAYAAKLAALRNPSIIRYQDPPPSLMNLLPMISRSSVRAGDGGQGPGATTFNGINISASADAMDRLTTPRMLYRWRGQ